MEITNILVFNVWIALVSGMVASWKIWLLNPWLSFISGEKIKLG
jgi:hypothetical protein